MDRDINNITHLTSLTPFFKSEVLTELSTESYPINFVRHLDRYQCKNIYLFILAYNDKLIITSETTNKI